MTGVQTCALPIWNMKGNVLGLTPGQIDLAIDAFRKALLIKPADVAAQTGLVALYMRKGDIDGTRKELDLLRKVAPKQINTKFFEANLAFATGHFTEAQSTYQSILKVLPLNPDVLLNAAETELKLNATAQAETMAGKALSQSPNSLRARQVLAKVYLRAGQPAKAVATLTSLLDSVNVTPELLAIAAQAQLMNGNVKEADQLYIRMAKLEPSDPQLRTLIASSGFGKLSDDTVFTQLNQIAKEDTGSTADLAIISAHIERQQYGAALRAATALSQKRPGDPLAHHLRGQIQARQLDFAAARRSFDEALTANANYYPAVAALAALDLLDNKPEAAQQRFKNLLKSQPKEARAMLAIAELMERQNHSQADVLKQIQAAVTAAPNDASLRQALISHLFNTGHFEAALNAAQSATGAMPNNLDLLELQARCYMRLNQGQQALSIYGKINSLYPKSPRGHIGMAAVHLQGNDMEQAQRSNDRAQELSPGTSEVLAQAILVAMRRQNFDKAVAIARTLQTARPNDATGLLLEAEVEIRRANWVAAVLALRKAVDKPEPGAAPVKLYAVLVKDGRAKEAQGFAAQWLKSHPRDVAFMLGFADVAMANGDTSTAEQRYLQLLKLAPEHVFALNNLAMLHLQLNKPGATELAEKAAKLAPYRADVLDTLAQALARENKLTKAIEVQQRAVLLAPDLADLRLALATLLIEAGEKPAARAEIERLAKLGPSYARQDEVAKLKQALEPSLPGR